MNQHLSLLYYEYQDTLKGILVEQGLRRLRALGLNFGVSPEGVRRLASLGPTLTALSYAGDMTQTRSRRCGLERLPGNCHQF